MEETPGRASLEKLGCRTPPQLHTGGVGRQHEDITENERMARKILRGIGNEGLKRLNTSGLSDEDFLKNH